MSSPISETALGYLAAAFAAQKQAIARDPVPSLECRLDRIRRLRTMLTDREADIRVAIQSDFGSLHPAMVVALDTLPVISRVNYFETELEGWMKPRQVELGGAHGSSSGEVVRVPKGVNGNIAPWNFPIESALVMVVDMFSAGNTVIIKPSELAPATAQILDDLVREYFSTDELAVVQGGADVAQAFAAMPWDHLTFTGSGRVGRVVMEAAAKNLVPVTLELGGKNPVLFAPDGVGEELVRRLLSFKTLKAGQICTSPDYVLVHEDQLETWVDLAAKVWRGLYPTYIGHPDATGIINEHHYRRVVGYLDEARARGVRVVDLNGDEPDAALRQVPMTLVIDPPADLGCMIDEVFGPVMSVVPYATVDEAMMRINSGPSPLGAYVVTNDEELAQRFALTVRSGGTGINTFGLQGGHAALPFGGFGASGHGCHSGYEGFCNYTHVKSVFRGSDDSFVHQAITPPYHAVPA